MSNNIRQTIESEFSWKKKISRLVQFCKDIVMNGLFDSLLIVFANHNGMRTTHGLTSPRIKMTIDSFKKHVPFWESLNVLCLDNNSTDESDKLLVDYVSMSEKWTYEKRLQEDYYLGTLFRLVSKFKDKYKYIMLVDNDQYFFTGSFLEEALSVMDTNDNVVCVPLCEGTVYDHMDRSKSEEEGTFLFIDRVWCEHNRIWLKAAKEFGNTDFFQPTVSGHGVVTLPHKRRKRVCWLWYPCSNVILRTLDVLSIFKTYEEFLPPYSSNIERLANFANKIGQTGETVYPVRGASINIGYRKFLSTDYDLNVIIQQYDNGKESDMIDDNRSFFFDGKNFSSIKEKINDIQPQIVKLN